VIPGGEKEVSVSWDVPADSSNSHEIFAVVDPDLAVDDRDRSNNTASKFAVLPDVGVKNSWSTELSPDSVMLIARIANTGVTAAKHVTVSWRIGSREGTEIGSDLIGTLACGGFYEASCVWDVDGVFDSSDYVKVFGVVSSASGVPDFDERNNTFSLLVNNPGPEGMLADLSSYILQQVAWDNIDAEMEVSLLAKVNAAIAALNRGNPNDAKVAMNDLKALINQVEAQTDKKIKPDAAAAIIERANAIITALGG